MRLITVALAGTIAVAGYGAPSYAQQVKMAQAGGADASIVRSFRSVVGREPSERELLRYRTLMIRNGWSEQDVRRDLAARGDYRKYRNDTGTRPNEAVRSAYQDILGREPDAEGLRNYRAKMTREGWSEQDVRDALRNSAEYASATGRTASADRIIRRAYMDVLHREPDPEGLAEYRRQVIENGWEYYDLRQVLARSEEGRAANSGIGQRGARRSGVVQRGPNRGGPTADDANAMVRRAYLSVLNREPDQSGLSDYTAKILHEGWTEARLMQALRESDEYRNRNR
jgi:TorA maturation chaperone TorD